MKTLTAVLAGFSLMLGVTLLALGQAAGAILFAGGTIAVAILSLRKSQD